MHKNAFTGGDTNVHACHWQSAANCPAAAIAELEVERLELSAMTGQAGK